MTGAVPAAGPHTGSQQTGATLMPWAPTHYGCRVVEIGDDGEYAVAGHVEPRRALAAVRRYLRVDCGVDDMDRWLAAPRIRHRWVIPVDAGMATDEDGWLWADDGVRQPITVVEL